MINVTSQLLLCTGKEPISVYEMTAKDLDKRRFLPRRELWNKAWSDTSHSGQLIDHFENSLQLTPLELQTVALHCLQDRYTTEYLRGDVTYMLMGFLRHRPDIVPEDDEFPAFARLSSANDSNMLLERLICLNPNNLDEEWSSLSDTWDATLWDIYPKVQVCGLGEGDTVILDGAHGAAIRWDEFVPVQTLGEESMRHRLLRWALRTMPGLFVIGLVELISTLAVNQNLPAIAGGIMLGLSGIIVLTSPYLLRLIYCVPTHNSQPFFFGFEGYLNLYDLELLIFGSYEARLSWSTASSPLSRHTLDREGFQKDFELDEQSVGSQNFCLGLDPVKSDPGVKELVEKAKSSTHKDQKIFTLVDTYTMTVTLFEAVHPRIAVIVCGAEGGMQRAFLCSEDWTSGTLFRETVLRMETRVWDKMDTLARIRLGLKRTERKTALENPSNFVIRKGPWWKRLAYAVGARIRLLSKDERRK